MMFNVHDSSMRIKAVLTIYQYFLYRLIGTTSLSTVTPGEVHVEYES